MAAFESPTLRCSIGFPHRYCKSAKSSIDVYAGFPASLAGCTVMAHRLLHTLEPFIKIFLSLLALAAASLEAAELPLLSKQGTTTQLTATTLTPASPAKRVAIVFDDGPKPADAEPLLALLAQEKIHVTFSLVGVNVDANPETAKKIAAAGHEIANHSQTHAHPRDLKDDALDQEVAVPQKKLTSILGYAPRWYWPPFIEIDDRLHAAVARAQLTVYIPRKIVASMDYDTKVSAAEILRRATTGIEDGTVILNHEWRAETRQQLPAILAELRRQNCVFLTFSELHDALAPSPEGGAAARK